MLYVLLLIPIVLGVQETYMSLQGRVTKPDGRVLDIGTLAVNISTQNSCSAGVIWNNTYAGGIKNGVFTVLLGDTHPMLLDFNQIYYLCTFVNGETVSGPSAFRGGQGMVDIGDMNTTSDYEFGNLNITGVIDVGPSFGNRIRMLFVSAIEGLSNWLQIKDNVQIEGNTLINGSLKVNNSVLVVNASRETIGINNIDPAVGLTVGEGNIDFLNDKNDVYIAGDLEVDGSTWLGDDMLVDNITITGRMDVNGSLFFEGLSIPTVVNITAGYYNGSLNGLSTNGLRSYKLADYICQQEFNGSHLCHAEEVINIIQAQNVSYMGRATTWGAGAGTVAEAWVAEGAPGYKATANDCAAYTSNSTNDLGAWWGFDFSVGSSIPGGAGWITNCNYEKQIACCS